MLGAIIGDIAGSRFEFNPTNDYDLELLAAGCDFTDDTICTVAVADALLRGRDFAECIHEWCQKYPDPMGGYGGRFATWVQSRDPKPYNSFGNGAAMRVSPVAWAYTNMFKMLPVAEATAACTHNHPEGIKGAQTVAMAIRKAIELNECYGSFGEPQMRELLKTCVDFSGYNIRLRKEDVQNKFDETCQGTVPVALWIIAQSTGFEDAVRKAVSLGADADTLGAIVGSIAEAIWGIPDDLMLEVLDFLPEDMKHVVLRFYSRYIKNSILHGYGDEGAARDLMLEEEEKLRRYKQRKRLEKLEKEDGSYDRKLVRDFINEKLDGDINKLADFDFGTLIDDARFGNCKGYAFSVDKCDIVQAIQSLAFGDVWPELTMNTVEDYTYTCSSIHEMHYLFGANILDQYFKGMQKFSPSKEQHERALRVNHLLRHIGNIWILPKRIDIDKDTYVYHGYVDKWLKAVYAVMTGDKSADGGLKGTLYQVRKQMVNYQGAEGFQKLMEDLMLEDFIDEEGKPKQVLPYVWSMMKGLSREEYFKAVDAYCSFMEDFIPKRGKMIVEKVRYMLAHDNMVQRKHIARMIEEEDHNEYAKVGYRYIEVLNRIAAEKDQQDKSVLFETLDNMRLEDGYSLGIRLADNEGMGDESWFYIYRKDGKIVYDDIPEPLDGEGGFGMSHVFVERTKMGAWQTYLFSIASTVLPTFWHGGYIRRTYIFKHDDLKGVITTHNLGEAPLYGIKDDIQPKVKIRGNEATVQCCYWNEWEGLVRETMLVRFAEGTVLSMERKDYEVLFEYDCGICF